MAIVRTSSGFKLLMSVEGYGGISRHVVFAHLLACWFFLKEINTYACLTKNQRTVDRCPLFIQPKVMPKVKAKVKDWGRVTSSYKMSVMEGVSRPETPGVLFSYSSYFLLYCCPSERRSLFKSRKLFCPGKRLSVSWENSGALSFDRNVEIVSEFESGPTWVGTPR